MTQIPRSLRLAAAVPLAALSLTACADGAADPNSTADGATVTIVASTNVYGDIAEVIAGDRVEVTSIITSAAQDPHEYEASTRDRLALDGADIVIKNGGGYDPFMDLLLDGSSADAVVLDAVEVSGLASENEGEAEEGAHADEADEHADEEDPHEGDGHIEGVNEHVWYDFHAVEAFVEELGHELSEVDPDNATAYEANVEAFVEELKSLEKAAASVRETAEGRGVALTEPLPVYLLESVGLVNHTPEEFSEAVEEGADVPPRALQETLDLFTSEDIAVLAFNEQTADGTTEQVRAAAEAAGVPVVNFTETLPDGQSYLEWQRANVDNLAAALG